MKLQSLINKTGWSQGRLSREMGVAQSTISRWKERHGGEIPMKYDRKVEKILKGCGSETTFHNERTPDGKFKPKNTEAPAVFTIRNKTYTETKTSKTIDAIENIVGDLKHNLETLEDWSVRTVVVDRVMTELKDIDTVELGY